MINIKTVMQNINNLCCKSQTNVDKIVFFIVWDRVKHGFYHNVIV